MQSGSTVLNICPAVQALSQAVAETDKPSCFSVASNAIASHTSESQNVYLLNACAGRGLVGMWYYFLVSQPLHLPQLAHDMKSRGPCSMRYATAVHVYMSWWREGDREGEGCPAPCADPLCRQGTCTMP